MIIKNLTKLFLAGVIMTVNVNFCIGGEIEARDREIQIEEKDFVSLAERGENDLSYAVEGGNIYYNPDTGTITDCDKSVTSANIPTEIDGVRITSIGDYAFSWCYSLTNITIPDSVTSIGWGAFSSCTSLTSINVDENNTNYTSIDSILFNKDTTEIICYPAGLNNENYSIPDSVTSIRDYAFSGCRLTSITIPDSVTSIGDFTFHHCKSLTSLTIPRSVISISGGEWGETFSDCSENLTIYCYENSYIQTYAEEYNIPYQIITDSDETTETTTKEITESTTKEITETTTKEITETTTTEITETTTESTQGIAISKEYIEIPKGSTLKLTASEIGTAASLSVKWESSAPNIAEVDQTGLVKGTAKGTAVIKASTEDGKFTDELTVIVKETNNYPTHILGDLNGDGILTANDAAILLQKVLDKHFKFPIES